MLVVIGATPNPEKTNKGKSRCGGVHSQRDNFVDVLDNEGFAVKLANPQFYLSPRFMYEFLPSCKAAKKNLLLRHFKLEGIKSPPEKFPNLYASPSLGVALNL